MNENKKIIESPNLKSNRKLFEQKLTKQSKIKLEKKKEVSNNSNVKTRISLINYEKNSINRNSLNPKIRTSLIKKNVSTTESNKLVNNSYFNQSKNYKENSQNKTKKKYTNQSMGYNKIMLELDSFNEETKNDFQENNILRIINNMNDLLKSNQFNNYLLNKTNENDTFYNNYIKKIFDNTLNLKKENNKNIKNENLYINDENKNDILKESNQRIQTYNKVFSIIFQSLNELTKNSNNNESENHSIEENVKNVNFNFNVNVNNIVNKNDLNDPLLTNKKEFPNNKNNTIGNFKEHEKNLPKIDEEHNSIGQMDKYQFKVQKQNNGKNYINSFYLLTPDEIRLSINNFSLARNRLLNNKNKELINHIKTEINNNISEKNKKIKMNTNKKISKNPINNNNKSARDNGYYFNQDFIATWKQN